MSTFKEAVLSYTAMWINACLQTWFLSILFYCLCKESHPSWSWPTEEELWAVWVFWCLLMLFLKTSAISDCSIYGIFHNSFQLTWGRECKGKKPSVTKIVYRQEAKLEKIGLASILLCHEINQNCLLSLLYANLRNTFSWAWSITRMKAVQRRFWTARREVLVQSRCSDWPRQLSWFC